MNAPLAQFIVARDRVNSAATFRRATDAFTSLKARVAAAITLRRRFRALLAEAGALLRRPKLTLR
jgi:hypothetical protein